MNPDSGSEYMHYTNASSEEKNKVPTIGMKKKVLYLITKSNWGGAQRYVYDLAVNLPKDRYEAMVACGGTGELVKRCADAHIPVMEIPNLERDISMVKEVRALFSIMDIVRSARPDILHINSSKAGGLGALAGHIMGVKKIIFTVHGWAFREKRNALWRLSVWLASFITVLLSHNVIAVSKKDRSDSPLRSKTVVIKNGIDEAPLLPKQDARESLSQTPLPNAVWVGVVAELTANKGIDVLLQAVPDVQEAHFFIAGNGEDKNYLVKMAQNLGISDRVTFLGQVQNVARYLTAFDIFVLPSRKEGLPYTLLEAGSAGLPVVATNVGGIPEIVEHEKTGLLVPPKDPRSLANALKRLIANEPFRKKLGTALKQKVEREFSLDSMLEQTATLY